MPHEVFIVDDHLVVRRALRTFLEEELGFATCGEAASYEEAVDGITRCNPDFVLVDLSLGSEEQNGFHLIEHLTAQIPPVPTLVVSAHEALFYRERARRAGAQGYVVKRHLRETLPPAIEQLLANCGLA